VDFRGGVAERGLPAGERLSRLRERGRGLVLAFGLPAGRWWWRMRPEVGGGLKLPAGEPPDRNAACAT